MDVVLEEKITITTQKTNLDDVVIARYYAPQYNKDFSVYLHKNSLNNISTIAEAEKIMLKKGYYAYPKKAITCLQKGKPLPEEKRFVNFEKDISYEQLLIDKRNQKGFIYQFGSNIPINVPLCWQFNTINQKHPKKIEKQILSHPNLEIYQKQDTFWKVYIFLEDKDFANLYQFVEKKYSENLYAYQMTASLIYHYNNYPDLLGIREIIKADTVKK